MILNLFGGVALLLYGMRLMGDGMQNIAGSRMRHILGTLTGNRVIGLGTGALVTALLQSSSATTVMLVGFVSAGFMALEPTLGVILGADIGTTLTVQLIALNILEYAPLLIGLGAALILATRQRQYHYVGQAVLGFGFIFMAMRIVGETAETLPESEMFGEVLVGLEDAPILMILIAAAFTAVVQSSAGTIGVALVLVDRGVMTLSLAIPIMLGANIGTSATALISSLGTTPEARRVAVAHLLFKVLGAVLVFPLMGVLAALVTVLAGDPARQVAHAHSLFNVGIALLFLPLTRPFAWFVRRLIPEREEGEEPFRARYLDSHVLDSPALAVGQATREVLRAADIVQGMVRDSIRVFERDDIELLQDIRRRDDRVDLLEAEIKRYLSRLGQHDLTEELSKQEIGLLYVANDLEIIGDIVDLSLMDLANDKIQGRHTFSEDGMAEIRDLHAKVAENLDLAVAAYTAGSVELGEKVLRHKVRINQIERQLRRTHINRLHAGMKVSLDTSSIHLDVLSDLKRINSHATNIAYVVLGEI